jgi:hypothetical protein
MFLYFGQSSPDQPARPAPEFVRAPRDQAIRIRFAHLSCVPSMVASSIRAAAIR